MARDDVGEFDHQCGTVAKIRRNKNGRLYLNCPSCGILHHALAGGQNMILELGRFYGPEGAPEKPQDPKTEAAETMPPPPIENPKKDAPTKSWW